jgi:GTP diphosphokinase / guanosine-3',5'-bis(diphosphate) 3'-diphosphatase
MAVSIPVLDEASSKFIDSIAYLPSDEQSKVCCALEKVTLWHEGQKRESGEPYVVHPIVTAMYLAKLECSPTTIIAGLLHDVVEDDAAPYEQIEQEFGDEVARIVDAVTKMTKLHYQGRRSERQIASLRKMLLAASDDLRVILVKLTDRLHNIETLEALRPDKQERIARETLDIYVPFARIMGLWRMKRQFEEKCFPLAFPQEADLWHKEIRSLRQRLLKEREEFCTDLSSKISIPITIELSVMTDYELYLKCDRNIHLLQNTSLVDSILLIPEDPTATTGACYQVLGDIHQAYPVRSGSLLDFVGQPLLNGYRGLHTTVFLSHGHQMRVRVQTQAMQEYASMRKYSSWINDKKNELYRALDSLHRRFHPSACSVSGEEHEEYVSELKENVLKEKMSIFTPAGDIVTLPRGSNGIDLAFAINPDFLQNLIAIRLHDEEVEATHVLHDGDTVELVLHDHLQHDSKTENVVLWRQRAHTGDARDALREAAEKLPKDQLICDGQKIVQHECHKYRLPDKKLFKLEILQNELCKECEVTDFDELLRKIGAGYIPTEDFVESFRHVLLHPQSMRMRLYKYLRLLPSSSVLAPKRSNVRLEIFSDNRPGMVHDITRCFVDRNISISKFVAYSVPPNGALYKIHMEIDDFETFSDLYDALLLVPSVKRVLRKR